MKLIIFALLTMTTITAVADCSNDMMEIMNTIDQNGYIKLPNIPKTKIMQLLDSGVWNMSNVSCEGNAIIHSPASQGPQYLPVCWTENSWENSITTDLTKCQ